MEQDTDKLKKIRMDDVRVCVVGWSKPMCCF